MKTIIIYNSQTGFTKQYAEWLAEDLQCRLVPYSQKEEIDFSQYDAMVFGSWCHAGMIKKIKWFRKNLPALKGKKKAVFVVGANPMGNQEIEASLKGNFSEEEKVEVFYLQGGLRYEKMGASSRMMMKMFSSMVAKKKNKSPEEEQMARMIGQSYDISDRRFLRPVAAYLKGRQD